MGHMGRGSQNVTHCQFWTRDDWRRLTTAMRIHQCCLKEK